MRSLIPVLFAGLVAMETVHADSLNCRFVGNWPFGACYAVAVDSSRQLAFCGSGGGVYVLDISDRAHPIKLSEAIHTRGAVEGLFCYNTQLYIAVWSRGLEIWDVSSPANPVFHGFCSTPGYARSVFVTGNSVDTYAYVADWYRGLRIIRVSDPLSPVEIAYCDSFVYATGVWIDRHYAYLSDWYSGLLVFDIADPYNPVRLGSCGIQGTAYGVGGLLDRYCYLANGSFGGVSVIDVSDPVHPYRISDAGGPNAAEGVWIARGCAYVAEYSGRLNIWSLADPRFPNPVGNCVTQGMGCGVFVCDTTAWLADYRSLRVINVANPANPVAIDSLVMPSWARDIAVSGSYAYVASDAGVYILNVGNPANPRQVGFYATRRSVSAIACADHYAYAAVQDSGLIILDVQNPESLVRAGTFRGSSAGGVSVTGEYAFLAGNGLHIVDVGDPWLPIEIGHCSEPTSGRTVVVLGNYAYVTDYSRLWIIRISPPNNPTAISFWDSMPTCWGADVVRDSQGVYAGLAADQYGLLVLDVTNPVMPHVVGRCSTGGFTTGVAISGDYAYVSDEMEGLTVLDISDPGNPRDTAHYDARLGLVGVRVHDGLAYTVGEMGVQIFQCSDAVACSEPGTNASQQMLSVSPNPAPGDFRVRLGPGAKRLRVFDAAGRSVRSVESASEIVQVRGLPSGVYLLCAQTRSGTVMRKVVIQR